MKPTHVMFSLVFLSLIAVTLSMDDAFALKSEGTSTSKYGSATKGVVCGDRLCSEIPGGYEAWKQGMYPVTEKEPEVQEAEPEPAMPSSSMTQLSENVYHYFGGFYSSLIVISDTDVLITDPSNDMRAQMLKEEIANITDVPVTKIVLTHEHYDHAGGTSIFEGAEVICQRNCQDMFDLDPFGTTPETVDVTFDAFLSIDIGNAIVELHYFGPGDGEATTVIYLPEEQIIASADMYEPYALTDSRWMDDKNYSGVHKIFNTVKDWPIKHAVNGHSQGTDPSDLYASIEFTNDLYDAVHGEIISAMNEGGPFAVMGLIDTLPHSLTLEKYSDWNGYDEHFPKHVERMLFSLFHGD